jgi:hypothetical protein
MGFQETQMDMYSRSVIVALSVQPPGVNELFVVCSKGQDPTETCAPGYFAGACMTRTPSQCSPEMIYLKLLTRV